MSNEVRFLVLGPVRVGLGGSVFGISATRERILLAMLLLQEGRVVSQDLLQDAIWGDSPPKDARNQVHRCMSRLRGRLARTGADSGVLATDADGYRVVASAANLDLLEFRRLRDDAKRAAARGDTSEAAVQYRAALELWRGPACVGVDSDPVRHAADTLDAERVQTLEECAWAELDKGDQKAGELIPELAEVVRQHPYRERLYAALMLAHYRAGRQADALAVYRRLRDVLHDELGTEPGSGVRQLHHAILCQDPALSQPAPVGEQSRGSDLSRSVPGTRFAPTLPTAPRELPGQAPGFVGRDSALKALDEINERGDQPGTTTIAAIVGPSGMGKTALAVHWAHLVSDDFPDGQLYINMRGYSTGTPLRPVEALGGLLRSLGAPPERIPAVQEDAARLYRSYLADRRMLVVLDNACSADQIRPLLPGSSGCVVVVTSRDRLMGLVARDGARRIALDVLTPEDAKGLLTYLLGADVVRAEPRAADVLARECDYLPLALRLAAASITDHPDPPSISAYITELQ